jgi:predicted phosphodiesterase
VRLAAISDMHGNAVAFEAVINDLRRQRPDAIVCLGDVVMRGPQPKECVDMLRALNPLVTVRGNFDHRFTRWPGPTWSPKTYKDELLLRDFEYTSARLDHTDQVWLGTLPVDFSSQIGGLGVELYHAAPGSLVQYTWPWAPAEDLGKLRVNETSNLVLFGHMHHAFVRSAMGFTVVNTGSVGLSFDGDNRASYAIIDIDGHDTAIQLRRVAYDVEAAIQVARSHAMPDVDVFAYALRHADYPYAAPVAST